MASGFALASKGHLNVWLFLSTLVGLSFLMASASVFNNYLDREMDKKMARTKNRALAKGTISVKKAILFATLLGLLGILVLALFTNLLTVWIALAGFFAYVVLYGIWKYRSIYGTVIGSISGSVPPVVGYCAVSHSFDMGAFLLFMILALWQMPHFFAIALYRLEDYAAASIPVLPVIKGVHRTKIHMLFYIIAFMVVLFLLNLFGYTGSTYLVIAALLSCSWLWLCIQGFKSDNHQLWARKMFLFSLIVIVVLSVIIAVDGVA